MAALLAELCRPDQPITLITSSATLLCDLESKASDYAKKWLRSKGVRLVFNTRVVEADERAVKVISELDGTQKEYQGFEFVFWAILRESSILATPLLKGKIIEADQLDVKGRIMVRRTLQLLNFSNIFAAGDCAAVKNSDVARYETFFSAMEAGRIAAENVQSMAFESKSHMLLNRLSKFDTKGILTSSLLKVCQDTNYRRLALFRDFSRERERNSRR